MSSLEFEGKNVDKAVKNACDELNLAADEISYQVLSRGSTGIFGLAGTKKARIKVTLPQKAPEIGADADIEKPVAPVFEDNVESEPPLPDHANFGGPQRHSFEENPLYFPGQYCSVSSMQSLPKRRYRPKKKPIGFC